MPSISRFVVFRGGVEGLSSSMHRNYARQDELPLQDCNYKIKGHD